MKDTIRILNRYRKAIARDDNSFHILCLLYKDSFSSEEKIHKNSGIKEKIIRETLRSLYRDNFVSLNSEGLYFLTSFAENVLSQLGVDEVVAPAIIDDLVEGEDAADVKRFFDLSVKIEPSSARNAVTAFHNLRVFFAEDQEISKKDRVYLAFASALHPDSQFRIFIKNDALSHDDVFPSWFEPLWVEHKIHGWKSEFKKFVVVSHIADESDALLAYACSTDRRARKFSDAGIAFSALRISNYRRPDERDSFLEACTRADQDATKNLFNWLTEAKPAYTRFLSRIMMCKNEASSISEAFSELLNRKTSMDNESFRQYQLCYDDIRAWRNLLMRASGDDSTDIIENLKAVKMKLDVIVKTSISPEAREEIITLVEDIQKLINDSAEDQF